MIGYTEKADAQFLNTIERLTLPYDCEVKFKNGEDYFFFEHKDFSARVEVGFAKNLINSFFSSSSEMIVGEGFMHGKWEMQRGNLEDLLSIFWNIKNESASLTRIRKLGNWRRFMMGQKNDPATSQKNIELHYDDDGKENKLFEQMLDSKMLYSSGIYENEGDSLETAQAKKLNVIIDSMNVQKGQKTLDIGSGWGSLTRALAAKGCDATGVTLSQQQLKYCNENKLASVSTQIANAGSEQYYFQDYREYFAENHNKLFDHITCIEVLDHVGVKQFDSFFKLIHQHLAENGTVLLQLILRPEKGQTSEWIDKYIYPGGYIASIDEVLASSSKAGLKNDLQLDYIGYHYSNTLRDWRSQLLKNRIEIEKTQDLDTVFFNKWLFYLSYSKSAFDNAGFSTCFLRLSNEENDVRRNSV